MSELRVNGYLDLSRVDVVPDDVAEPSVTLDVFGAVLKHIDVVRLRQIAATSAKHHLRQCPPSYLLLLLAVVVVVEMNII